MPVGSSTTTFKEPTGTMIYWSSLFHKRTGKIPFLIRKDIMRSYEAIVAVIGHEMYELEEMRHGRSVDRDVSGWRDNGLPSHDGLPAST
jgi:hypothetical protein